jgi:hypothetical protein
MAMNLRGIPSDFLELALYLLRATSVAYVYMKIDYGNHALVEVFVSPHLLSQLGCLEIADGLSHETNKDKVLIRANIKGSRESLQRRILLGMF